MADLNYIYQLLGEAVKLNYTDRKPQAALEKIDEVLKTDKLSYAYALKATILRELQRNDEAFKTVEEGLGYGSNDHVLLKLKAELLGLVGRYDEALYAAQQAQLWFEDSSKKLREFMKAMQQYDLEQSLISYLGTSAELRLLYSNIHHLKNAALIWARTENLEKALVGERARLIELLGLFTAILAFIFASVQVVSRAEFPAAYVLILGIGLVLLTFLLTLHLFLDPVARTRTAFAILVVLLVILAGLPWYGRLVTHTQSQSSAGQSSPMESKP